ncbi:uncharacterized protein MKK02DRAFT_41373 [Dioszegia hungarica]|uniref:Uncharacterized protein n=1 Tax=Dioszegia hungarica TaxID=4972 RepID=A0AA38H0X5_9TREE|nr:uncharacterized protein MKK02DRAFT_41373 [Dioszegia hungarica]KAI9631745.1 hypothetical protein MKK02DRAFT_41373 [Dioszegia hungarica]
MSDPERYTPPDPSVATLLTDAVPTATQEGTCFENLPAEVRSRVFRALPGIETNVDFNTLLSSPDGPSVKTWSISRRKFSLSNKALYKFHTDFDPNPDCFTLDNMTMRRILRLSDDADIAASFATRRDACKKRLLASAENDKPILLIRDYRADPALQELIKFVLSLKAEDSSVCSNWQAVAISPSETRIEPDSIRMLTPIGPTPQRVDWSHLRGLKLHYKPRPNETVYLDGLPTSSEFTVHTDGVPRFDTRGATLPDGKTHVIWDLSAPDTDSPGFDVNAYFDAFKVLGHGLITTRHTASGKFEVLMPSDVLGHTGFVSELKKQTRIMTKRFKDKGLVFSVVYIDGS